MSKPTSDAPVFHFSEDPSIERFEPHVPPTNPSQAPAVWAIDAEHAPVYWFPRNCPRGSVWADTPEQQAVLSERFHTAASRVQATELDWLDRIRAARLFVYEFDPAPFERWPDADGQWVAHETVVPIRVRPVGDVLALHAAAGVELRFVPDLLVFWESVITSGLPFSGVRLRNARNATRAPSAR
ncbi:MAG TPA: hypothetical protein VHL56_06565 [Candidatus Limnocylindrales bacterium]|nr:hypothetical protein [Candidatus Limnocylindrales bacterium]